MHSLRPLRRPPLVSVSHLRVHSLRALRKPPPCAVSALCAGLLLCLRLCASHLRVQSLPYAGASFNVRDIPATPKVSPGDWYRTTFSNALKVPRNNTAN